MSNQIETRRTDWIEYGHYGMAAYRIWKQRDGHRWYQRHEWRAENGRLQMDEWIKSIDGFSDGMQPAYSELAAI